jgi:predicted RNA binding protein YcfA (HicA-like mRNA interferase family)
MHFGAHNMSRQEKLLAKFLAGKSDNNFSFSEFVTVIIHAGYRHERTTGSHAVFSHPTFPTVNIQPRSDGKAKSYQMRQVREILRSKP